MVDFLTPSPQSHHCTAQSSDNAIGYLTFAFTVKNLWNVLEKNERFVKQIVSLVWWWWCMELIIMMILPFVGKRSWRNFARQKFRC